MVIAPLFNTGNLKRVQCAKNDCVFACLDDNRICDCRAYRAGIKCPYYDIKEGEILIIGS